MGFILGLLKTLFHMAVGLLIAPLPAWIVLDWMQGRGHEISPLAWAGAMLASGGLYWGFLWYRRVRAQRIALADGSEEFPDTPGQAFEAGAKPPWDASPLPPLPLQVDPSDPDDREGFAIRAAHRLRAAGWRVEWFEETGELGFDLIAGRGAVTLALWCYPDPRAITAGDVHRAVAVARQIGVGAAAFLTAEQHPAGIRNLAEQSGLVLLTASGIETLWQRFPPDGPGNRTGWPPR